MRLVGLFIIVIVLAGCQTASDRRAATLKGACESFVPATVPVLGKRRQDQRWIDGTIESQVSACGFPRPRAPASS